MQMSAYKVNTRLTTRSRPNDLGRGNAKKFVLVIGARHRDVCGPQGRDLAPGMKSDEYRVWGMNNLLGGEARVITLNKNWETDNKYHLDHDTTLSWARLVNVEVADLGGTITDVYVDYFFFLPSWYREGYGTKWLENLAELDFTGKAYLPIPKVDEESEDAEYPEHLVQETTKRGGQFISDRKTMEDIPWCKATINVEKYLTPLRESRTHIIQIQQYIKGFVVFNR